MNSIQPWILIAILLLAPLGPSDSAEPPVQPGSYRDTPSPLNLLANQWSSYPTPPAGFSLEFLRSRDAESAQLTLKESILIGLKNNPGIEVDRLEPARAVEQTMIEKSLFDPMLTLELKKNYSIEPSGAEASPFFQPVQTNQNRNYDLRLKKTLRTGAQAELSLLNNRFVGSLPNQALKPQYRPRLGFSLTQPLLRDFGWGLTTIFVRMSENREDISLFDYQAKLAQLIQRITEAYWGVVFAEDHLQVQRKGVVLADALLKDAEARVRVGALAAVAITEAKAEKARRDEQVIVAENRFDLARADLRLALNLNPKQTFQPRRIDPIEPPSVEPVQLDRMKSLEEAVTRRPEILSAAMAVQNSALQLRYAENQLLPRLDFKLGAGLTGIAGSLKPGAGNPFSGDYGTALERVGRGDFYNYSVGVTLQIPLGNGQARSKFAQARIELEQARARQRDLVSQVILEVERALGDVESGFKRIQTTRQARDLAEENLRSQEKRLQVALVTQKDVIDYQVKYLEAQGAEVRAVTDYNNAISRLRLAEGTLLESFNVKVEGPKKEPDPWWAKF